MTYTRWLGFAAAFLAGCFVTLPVWHYANPVPARFFVSEAVASVPASSHVQVSSGGSGTHIGNGFILSAAHVVREAKTVTVTGDNGTKYEAEVLWANVGYDVALLRVSTPTSIGVTPLSCAPNYTGQKVQAFGNPMGVEFVYTRGEVNGVARQHGPWKRVIPLDMTTIYGQSGGGVIDADGNLVGVTVGLLPTPYGITAFGWAVPGEAVCDLLAREA